MEGVAEGRKEWQRVMPHSDEAERMVLGTIMNDREALPLVRPLLPASAFYSAKHRAVYEAASAVADGGGFPDLVAVMDELSRRGSGVTPWEVAELSGCTTPYVEQHAAAVFDKYKRRQFFEVACYLESNCFNESEDVLDVREEALRRLDGIFPDAGGTFTMRDAVRGVYELMSRNLSSGRSMTGSPTGFRALDSMGGGIQPSSLVVIAGGTSNGKTSLAAHIAASAGCPVAFYSMEMRKEEIAARLMASRSGVPASRILYSPLSREQLRAVDEGVAKVEGLPVYFDDRSGSTLESVLSSARAMRARHGIGGAVVDYLQILGVNARAENREQQMGEAARRLKNLAKDLGIWVVAVSQLNRDRADPVPNLSRLRASGQIAEAADVVLLVYRPEAEGRTCYPDPFGDVSVNGTAMIDVAKGRNIGTGRFIAGFDAATASFRDLEELPAAGVGGLDTPF